MIIDFCSLKCLSTRNITQEDCSTGQEDMSRLHPFPLLLVLSSDFHFFPQQLTPLTVSCLRPRGRHSERKPPATTHPEGFLARAKKKGVKVATFPCDIGKPPPASRRAQTISLGLWVLKASRDPEHKQSLFVPDHDPASLRPN